MLRLSFVALLALTLAACGNDTPPPAEPDAEPQTDTAPVVEETLYDASALAAAVDGPWREEAARARDASRHPAETLEFFELDPASTIVEVWPGGGWYTDILAPWIAANDGRYIAAWPPVAPDNEAGLAFQSRFQSKFDDPLFGSAQLVEFGPGSATFDAVSDVDAIITFRNVHSMMRRGFAEEAFAAFFDVLRPGGHLGVVTHRQPAGAVQDPLASTGYVQQDYVVALAAEAGFELVASSEINANPADTADHPFGVWTLPPIQRTSPFGEDADPDFDTASYEAIGESDRMTLLFRKPASSE